MQGEMAGPVPAIWIAWPGGNEGAASAPKGKRVRTRFDGGFRGAFQRVQQRAASDLGRTQATTVPLDLWSKNIRRPAP